MVQKIGQCQDRPVSHRAGTFIRLKTVKYILGRSIITWLENARDIGKRMIKIIVQKESVIIPHEIMEQAYEIHRKTHDQNKKNVAF
jgi:hypothetical protein